MSTLPSSPTPGPSWKQEVNRRIAEHKSRKGFTVVDSDAREEMHASSNSRAAAAAARVAARYAKTPSYSELQAVEARAALRVAEVATRVAMEAQAAAQAVLDHLESKVEEVEAAPAPNDWRPREPTREPSTELVDNRPLEVRWDPDMPVLPAQMDMQTAVSTQWEISDHSTYDSDAGPIYETVDAAQPIPANLIQFPREIVATRRMRPRLAEASTDSSEPQQLSIFEVEPDSVSIEPTTATVSTTAEPTWIGTSWQEMELDEQPQQLPDYYAIPPADAPNLYQAPFGRRMMATMVDTAIILGLTCGAVTLLASKLDSLPGKHASEICGVLLVLGLATLYEWFFLTFAKVTPGMRYAQLSLCTFDEEIPTREQVKGRLKSMLVSVLPLGLGMIWSIFDDDQMSWHDRLSKTYLRLS